MLAEPAEGELLAAIENLQAHQVVGGANRAEDAVVGHTHRPRRTAPDTAAAQARHAMIPLACPHTPIARDQSVAT